MKTLMITLPEGTIFSFLATTPNGDDFVLSHVTMTEDLIYTNIVSYGVVTPKPTIEKKK